MRRGPGIEAGRPQSYRAGSVRSAMTDPAGRDSRRGSFLAFRCFLVSARGTRRPPRRPAPRMATDLTSRRRYAA
jgi:hypothetical protein